jgi:indolepyruvate ferredoxin oxidoreductase alpha subunit
MGSSISTAQGISRTTNRKTIALVGDSTFFHAALPGLVNAVYNNAKVVLAVLDNQTTAMTGNQPHPGTGMTGMGAGFQRVSIEKVAEGIGVKFVRVVNPFRIKESEAVLKEALDQPGPSVIVFRAPCSLMVVRERRRKGIRTVAFQTTEECKNCMLCIKLLGCPALIIEDGKVRIDDALCTACGLCVSVCPQHALKGVSQE